MRRLITAAVLAASALAADLPAAFALQETPPTEALAEHQTEAPTENPLAQALSDHSSTMWLNEDLTLGGPGAELLLREGEESVFFLIGEEHGIAQIPYITTALFRALQPAGYRHLAIEVGHALADTLDGLARHDFALESMVVFFNLHPPGGLFFNLQQEAQMLVEVVELAPDESEVLWGLDYDIIGDRFALRRLRDLAPNDEARAAVDRALALSDARFAEALETKNPGASLMFGGPDSVFVALREVFQPSPGSEADRILHTLYETVKINELFMSGRGYESNRRRAELNKKVFMDHFSQVAWEEDEPERVMLRFGGNHMMRGRTFTDVFDIGSLAAEIATAIGKRSFHLMVVGGSDTEHAIINPQVFEWVNVPVDAANAEWAAPLIAVTDETQWTLFDLRPLRPVLSAGRLGDVPERLARSIWAFDAILVLTGSTPSTPLPIDMRGDN
jgi:hypothetical protein